MRMALDWFFLSYEHWRAPGARKAIFCAASQRCALTRRGPGSTYKHSCDIFRMVAGRHVRHVSGAALVAPGHIGPVCPVRPHALRGSLPARAAER